MSSSEKGPRGEMPFLDHLEELRWRIFKALGAIVVGLIVGVLLVLYLDVAEILVRPVRPYLPEGRQLQVLGPMDTFFILLQLSFTVGLVLAFPIVAYQVWAFLSPALDRREKRVIIPSLYFGLLLFAAGVAMAYFVALPVSLRFFANLLTDLVEQNMVAGMYFSFVNRLLVAFGIVFELPVVVMILSVLGLVTPEFLRSKRRHAIVVIAVLASVLSPGDVVQVTILMMVPLIVLYEISIWLSKMIYRRKEKHSIADGIEPPDDSVEAM